ncbi:MAG TPA: dienelactone hydrolase family protein [bacterium]
MRTGWSIIFVLMFAFLATAQETTARLESSPRHHEWVKVKQGEREVHAYLTFPEVSEKVLAVLVIHENMGLTDWVRTVADGLAEAGYIAIAPDLLSGAAPEGGRTIDFASRDAAREAIYNLPPDQVTADLNAIFEYVAKLPAANGKVAVAGFCWGGAQTFRYATNRADLKAAFVFYGTGPDSSAISGIRCPVYGFYGGNDNRVNASIPKITEWMEGAGKIYEPVIYEGAGHGFMRAGEQPDATEANKKARTEGWERWKSLLTKL